MLILKVFLISMAPIGELRAGIPYGLLHDINPVLTYITAVLGNMVPVVFLLWGLPWIDKMLGMKASFWYKHQNRNKSKSLPARQNLRLQALAGWKPKCLSSLCKLYPWYKSRTKRKYFKRFSRLGALALISFVAIPLPITGAWTGSLAAYSFGVPPKKAIGLIFIGIIIAGVIVTLTTLTALHF